MSSEETKKHTNSDQRVNVVAKKKVLAKAAPAGDRIRAELNIEKWPAIWNPTHSKTHGKGNTVSRTLERVAAGTDGAKHISQVTINPIAHLGDLTTEDQRTLYTLIKHWEERGKPEAETPFSIRQLSRLLHKRGWGSNVIDAITGSLERLRGTLLVWTRSYKSRDERIENLETVYINILSKLKIVRRKVDGHITTEAGYFQFDDHILHNLLSSYTKPLLFDVFIDIKGEIALKLYSYLDLIMADKMKFERCTKDLFEDLGLLGASYRNPSKRKQNLERAVKELEGKLLTTGVIKSASIEKTKDGRDYKIVFQKGVKAVLSSEGSEPNEIFSTVQPVVINNYSKQKDPAMVNAEDVVKHFHQVVHGIHDHVPQSKELGQAISLISQYGFEQAKFVIDYAAGKAVETGFLMQHFGAVLSYASRAVAAFSTQQQVQRPAKSAHQLPASATVEEFARGKARFSVLAPEQLSARYEEAKAQLVAEVPFLAQQGRQGSRLHEEMIRARLIRQLDAEPMELMPPWLLEWSQANIPTQNSGL